MWCFHQQFFHAFSPCFTDCNDTRRNGWHTKNGLHQYIYNCSLTPKIHETISSKNIHLIIHQKRELNIFTSLFSNCKIHLKDSLYETIYRCDLFISHQHVTFSTLKVHYCALLSRNCSYNFRKIKYWILFQWDFSGTIQGIYYVKISKEAHLPNTKSQHRKRDSWYKSQPQRMKYDLYHFTNPKP